MKIEGFREKLQTEKADLKISNPKLLGPEVTINLAGKIIFDQVDLLIDEAISMIGVEASFESVVVPLEREKNRRMDLIYKQSPIGRRMKEEQEKKSADIARRAGFDL